MSELLVAIDRSTIREGRRAELEAAIGDLADFVRQNEPRVIAYSVYLDEDLPEMTVLQVHPDSASMEFHMATAGPAFPQFADLVQMRSMDVYGRPSEDLLAQLQKKVEMLGDATVSVHEPQKGFARLREAAEVEALDG